MINMTYVQFALCAIAFFVADMVDGRVFNGLEFATLTAVASLLIGFLVYKRKDPLKFYHDGQDERHFLRRQFPLVYAAIIFILVGIASLYLFIDKPFEVIAYVEHKSRTQNKGNVTHILGIRHERFGVLRYSVSEKVWLSQRIGGHILLTVQKDVLGLYVVSSVESAGKSEITKR